MSDTKIQKAVNRYIKARKEIIKLGKISDRISGNDNIIGRIGEFIALRFLESLGQKPKKVLLSSNPGYDLIDNKTLTQVKVITAENKLGRNVRLNKPWTQLVLIELDENYEPRRIGILTEKNHNKSQKENKSWSKTPIVKLTMLGNKGLIGRYGKIHNSWKRKK